LRSATIFFTYAGIKASKRKAEAVKKKAKVNMLSTKTGGTTYRP